MPNATIKHIATFNADTWSPAIPIGVDDANIDITDATIDPVVSNTDIDFSSSDVTVIDGDTGAIAWTKFNRLRKKVNNRFNAFSAFENKSLLTEYDSFASGSSLSRHQIYTANVFNSYVENIIGYVDTWTPSNGTIKEQLESIDSYLGNLSTQIQDLNSESFNLLTQINDINSRVGEPSVIAHDFNIPDLPGANCTYYIAKLFNFLQTLSTGVIPVIWGNKPLNVAPNNQYDTTPGIIQEESFVIVLNSTMSTKPDGLYWTSAEIRDELDTTVKENVLVPMGFTGTSLGVLTQFMIPKAWSFNIAGYNSGTVMSIGPLIIQSCFKEIPYRQTTTIKWEHAIRYGIIIPVNAQGGFGREGMISVGSIDYASNTCQVFQTNAASASMRMYIHIIGWRYWHV